MATYVVGCDVGGTFTDLVSLNVETGETLVDKQATTPQDQSIAVIQALDNLNIKGSEIEKFCHCFTVGINAVLTRTGVKCGLLTTAGFEDDLDRGMIWRDWDFLYDPTWRRPHQERPIIPKRHRLGIKQRVKYDGSAFIPLDEEDARKKVRFLKEEGIRSVAICFLNSYLDSSDEQKVKKIVKEIMPEAYVQTSELRPVAREFPRTMTVVLDAYVGPIVNRYLEILESKLRENNYKGDVLILQMTGGYKTREMISKSPAFALESGPVGGLVGSSVLCKTIGQPSAVTFDMGGTSTDVGLIMDYDPVITDEWQVEHDIPLYLPVLDVRSIGAGGGSVISVDEVGVMHVGPESTGAVPGPACYDRGGTKAALTDAYVLMGLVRPEAFLAGRMTLRKDLAEKAMGKVAQKLGLDLLRMADSAYTLATASTVQLIRTVMLAHLTSPAESALIAFGSAGPLHSSEIARQLGMPEVVVPLNPGCFSAAGLLAADLKVAHTKSLVKEVAAIGMAGFNESYKELDEACYKDLEAQGFSRDKIKIERVYYGMYKGQTWDVRFSAPSGDFDEQTLIKMRANYDEVYEKKFGYRAPELPVVITTLESIGYGPMGYKIMDKIKKGDEKPLPEALITKQDIFYHGELVRDVPFYDRRKLLAGNKIKGPAIIEEGLATTMLSEGDVLTIDENGLMRIRVKPI